MIGWMTGGFGGEVADFYARYRRGYPARVVNALATALELDHVSVVADLGCGSGQLTLPLARRVGRVIGVDPEPDMLRHAQAEAEQGQIGNVDWILGTTRELELVTARYGRLDAVTLANSVHLVDRADLFISARPALKPARRLAIIANGTPLWQQDHDWSRALRTFLERWLGTSLTSCCGTDDATRLQYRRELAELGYTVDEIRTDYSDILTLAQVIGGVFSAMSDRLPPADDRPAFAAELADHLTGMTPYVEQVSVRSLIARVR